MMCSSCQRENPDDARFCNACGASMEVVCAECARVNPAASRFCNGCGAGLVATDAPAPTDQQRPRDYTPRHLADKILRHKGALEGERKHVTVLFADLSESTRLAAGMGPEEMHALMDRAFQRILEQVHRYEGTVNQFTGDGVMALFGAPLALEHAPRRAVVAALGIQRALESLDAEVRDRFGRDFRMRIGIHTGPVVVGTIGDDLRMDYTAIGDTTNLAARLESIAEPGSVVISDATRRQVEGFFDLRALDPIELKGVSGVVQAHAVVAERPVSGRIEALGEADLTPYVGRSEEMDALMSAFDSAADGHGRVAFVVGEAGIGKSRLLHEFRHRIGAIPHTWLEGHCQSFAKSTAFHPVVDSIRRNVGIQERDDESAALAKLEQFESDAGGALEWTLPYVRQLLSLPTGDPEVDAQDAMARRSETCRALQARLLRMAEARPLVLLVEDLHWIDNASEEFLGFLADSIPAAAVLIVFTHRPGYVHPFGDRSFHVRAPLQALSRDSMMQMVGSVLESEAVPQGLQDLIAGKAEGNPLFIEEVSRSLLEEGIVTAEKEGLALARDLADVNVPDRIQDVLMARLDRLDEGPKRAIQLASVIGREFALRLLERIAESGDQIDSSVVELRSLELILQKASHPELAYMFKHALTHDVAYESVLLQRRQALHRIVGTAIEELYPDRLTEHFEALAHHFSEAQEWERALYYLELASAKAATAFANHAAATLCRAGLEIAERVEGDILPARKCALHLRLAMCRWMTSDFPESGDAFLAASEHAEDPRSRAYYTARAGFSYLWAHDFETAARVEDEALELSQVEGAEGARAFALMVIDEHDLVHGRGLTDETRAHEALELAERSGDPGAAITLLSHLGQRAEWRGDYRTTIALTERAVAIASEHRIVTDALFGQWFLGLAYTAIGEYSRGIGLLTNGLELCDRAGDRALTARLLNTVGWCYAEFGSHSRAAEYNRLGTNLAREMVELGLVAGAPELYANAAINLAGNLTALGDLDGAAEQLAPIQAQLDASHDPWMEWRYSLNLLDVQARIALARGEPDRALEYLAREAEGARSTGARKLEARALELQGRAFLAIDDREASARSLAAALEVSRAIEYPPVIWRAVSLQGELARRQGNDALAERHLIEAKRGLEVFAPAVPETELRREFQAMGERLVADPMTAFR